MGYPDFHSCQAVVRNFSTLTVERSSGRRGEIKSLDLWVLYPVTVPLEGMWKACDSPILDRNEGGVRRGLVENYDCCHCPGVMMLMVSVKLCEEQ